MLQAIQSKKILTHEQAEALYREITHIYNLADNVMVAIADERVTNRSEQLEITEPFINKVINSADIISELYIKVVCKKLPITPEIQEKFETAFSNIFHAYKGFLDAVEDRLLPQEYDNE
ncbi:MAG: hypothetical protein WCJ33_01770 [Pseudomonadota bacterium]